MHMRTGSVEEMEESNEGVVAGPSSEVTPAQVAIIKQTVEAVLRACASQRNPGACGTGGDSCQGSEPPEGGRGKCLGMV